MACWPTHEIETRSSSAIPSSSLYSLSLSVIVTRFRPGSSAMTHRAAFRFT